jgi:chromosome partitioning protein
MIAINLAAAAVQMGLKPLVICQDPQGTSSMIYEGGRLPTHYYITGEIMERKARLMLRVNSYKRIVKT